MIRLTTVLVIVPLLVACSSPDDDIGVPEAEGSGTPVDVTLTSYEIEMVDELPAGTVTFALTNDGDHDHGLAIAGGDIDRTLVPAVEAGSEATATFDLEPGTYTLYCPIGDHAERGMEIELTVTDGGS